MRYAIERIGLACFTSSKRALKKAGKSESDRTVVVNPASSYITFHDGRRVVRIEPSSTIESSILRYSIGIISVSRRKRPRLYSTLPSVYVVFVFFVYAGMLVVSTLLLSISRFVRRV